MCCALVLGIGPGHLLLPAWADINIPVAFFVFSSCLILMERTRRLRWQQATVRCFAWFWQLSIAWYLRRISSFSFFIVLMFSWASVSKTPLFLTLILRTALSTLLFPQSKQFSSAIYIYIYFFFFLKCYRQLLFLRAIMRIKGGNAF